MTEKRLFLLDAYALIFRAYYALAKMPRITQAGFNTSAIFGFTNTLEEVIRHENPTHIAVCFDPPGPTFRSEADASYKAERSATPEDIKASVPIIKELLQAYRIPVIEVEGYEADDVIGTLAMRARDAGFTTYMMTPDKDFGQLVGPGVLQYKPSYRGQDFELRGEEEVCARYGIERPSQVIDLLALMGDKVDNIPGCPGVGEKTAVKLIQEYGDVDTLLASTGKLKGAIRKKIEDHADQIRHSRYMATICTDVPVETTPDELVRQQPDIEKLFAIFRSLEFKSLLDRVARRLGVDASGKPESPAEMPGSGRVVQRSLFDDDLVDVPRPEAAPEVPSPPAEGYGASVTIVLDPIALDRMQRALLPESECGLCLATEGENDMAARWLGTGVVSPGGEGWYVPSSYEEGQAAVLDLMARPDIMKVTSTAKRDMVVAARHRTPAPEWAATALQNYADTGLMHYLLQPDMRHNISSLANTYLGTDPGYDVAVEPLKGRNKTLPAPAETAPRAVMLAHLALALRKPLEEELEREHLRHILRDIELPLVPVLAGMEMAGVRIDTTALAEASRGMEERMEILQKEIHELAGEEFNVGSPAAVGEILFGKMGLNPKAKKTKSGQYSTAEDVLEKIAHKSPIVGKILEYRRLKKLLNTYLSVLPESINPLTGHVHTNYNQTVTATGRISSSAPNLQNIPVRNDTGREIRRAFIADPGHLFLSADYSQIELRLVADLAAEEVMTDAFRHGKDIHAITAARIYHKTQDEVTADERSKAKVANFGILYGISAFGLSSRLGIPRGEAQELIDNYFKTFPAIYKYMSDSVEKARENLYTETPLGRKRRVPDINSKNPTVRGIAERNAINAPVQGAAADIIKKAMIDIDREIRQKGLKSRMTMQVHDELNFDVVPDELPLMQEMVSRLMEQAWRGSIPLTASVGTGTNWLDAH